MRHEIIGHGLRIGVLAGFFAAGFLFGSASQRGAEAQIGETMKELGGTVVEQAAGSGGALGSVTKLGSTIVEMQQNVDGLQKNIEVLRQVKAALGG